MLLCDVNVLIRAARHDLDDHSSYAEWLDRVVGDAAPYGVADIVLSGFLRVVTNPRAFKEPTPPAQALDFVIKLRAPKNCVVVAPGPRPWDIFIDLCRRVNARGNFVPDAYPAALAVESGSEWITTDRDYAVSRVAVAASAGCVIGGQ